MENKGRKKKLDRKREKEAKNNSLLVKRRKENHETRYEMQKEA